MPIERSTHAELSANNSSGSPESLVSRLVHRFTPVEFLQVKGREIFSNGKNLFVEAFNKNKLVIEEGCFNRLCGAPQHFLGGQV